MGRERRTVNWLRVAVYTTLTCFCLLLVQGRSAFGQVDEGAITGTVVDSTGAVIPNANVTLLNTDQGITLETKSGGNGGYTFSPVRAGQLPDHGHGDRVCQDNPEERHRECGPGAAGQRFAQARRSNRNR